MTTLLRATLGFHLAQVDVAGCVVVSMPFLLESFIDSATSLQHLVTIAHSLGCRNAPRIVQLWLQLVKHKVG